MFVRSLDQLNVDPALHCVGRPFLEVVSNSVPPLTQRFVSVLDNGLNLRPGVRVVLPDEKVTGLTWTIQRRMFYVPALRLSFSQDLSFIEDNKDDELPFPKDMLQAAPFCTVSKHAALKIRAKLDQEET